MAEPTSNRRLECVDRRQEMRAMETRIAQAMDRVTVWFTVIAIAQGAAIVALIKLLP